MPESFPELINPTIITGKVNEPGWFFEGTSRVKLLDGENNEILTSIVTARGEWMTTNAVYFSTELNFGKPKTKNGTLIFMNDNPSGLSEHDKEFIIPISFGDYENHRSVKLYFNDAKRDPNSESCGKVFPTTRKIKKVEGIAKATIEELLKGVSQKEKNESFFSNITEGVKIQSLKIENGTAYIDFNSSIETGGSCRVSAIRAQIEETLKQFETVSNVVISVNENIEEALQP